MSEAVFYWLGVIYTTVFGIGAAFILIGYVIDYCFSRMKSLYTLLELQRAWKEYDNKKLMAVAAADEETKKP